MENKERIKEFLEKETQKKIQDSGANLISDGVLDSFSMIKLISFIESELKIKVDMEKLSSENFNSLDKISDFLK